MLTTSSPMLVLSDDILIHIISMLPIKEQLATRASCKRLSRVCDSDRLWQVLCASGSIIPAPGIKWRVLGQRLSCHRWAFTGQNKDDQELSEEVEEDLGEGSPDEREQVRALLNKSSAKGPTGRWIKVLQSGPRYETFPKDILPFVDNIATPKPLTNHKGNNTASIGIIPIGLVKPISGSEEKGDFQQESNTKDDLAISLHKKIFSAMGVSYTGDWNELCEALRPSSSTGADSCPSIAMFDTMPHMGPRRIVAQCLTPGNVNEHPNATAKLTEVLFSTCSTVVFAAADAASLSNWLQTVSPHMSLVASPNPFSTPDNTPNVVFMTKEPLPSLRAVIAPTPTPMANPSTLNSSSTAGSTREAFSWILNRSNCVGEVVFDDQSCPLSLKTFYAPAWIAAECSLPIPAPTIARMLIAAGDADGGANNTATLWTRDVVQSICAGQARQCTRFYEEAMRTEISDANRPTIAFTNLPVPMDPAEIVSLQDHFFFASVRSYAMSVRHVCGSDTPMGMGLLEEFKKDISSCFRRLWTENIYTSRAYCTQLYDNIFYPVHEKYNGESSNGFQDKKGLHQWFGAVTDKISEYVIKAKGPRSMDVLSERITTRTIGGLKNFCLQHPEHPFVRIEDVSLAGAEISQYCAKQLSNYHVQQDEVLSIKQRNSAVYTACLGTMWAAESIGEAIKYLSMLQPEYDTWAELLQLKREGFGLAPSAMLSLTVTPATTAGCNSSNNNDAIDSETNSVSASSEVHSSSAAATRRSGASSRAGGPSPASPAPQLKSNATKVKTLLSNFLSGGKKESKDQANGNCVVFSELEVERQGFLQALVHKHNEQKIKMEGIGKQLNLRSDQTADFNVIQRQFSNGFKELKTARKVEDAADEIATRLRVMRERVKNSFSATRER